MSDGNLTRWLDSQPIHGECTFFCGQVYDVLQTTRHEIAPHPFFSTNLSQTEILKSYRDLFPDAVSWRSHSLVFSQSICVELQRLGYRNVSISERYADLHAQPVKLPWGPTDFGIYYMDNSDFCNFYEAKDENWKRFDRSMLVQLFETRRAQGDEYVYVFDFHPIHLALNTPSYDAYVSERNSYETQGQVSRMAAKRRGARTYFDELLELMKAHGVSSRSISDVSRTRRVQG
ncbi:MAG: hypothetical protein C5B58_15630 [Acidobacteria bacterium]|nr:MAG: hypothetical protein C5B58_15630 [Acidobacteriota bacterium]